MYNYMADTTIKDMIFVLKTVDFSTYKRTVCIFQIALLNLFRLSSDSIIAVKRGGGLISYCDFCICLRKVMSKMFSYQVSFRSTFHVVMFATISAIKRRSVRLDLQLFVGERMSYLRYLCLFYA